MTPADAVVCLGDLMVDVTAQLTVPLQLGSDAPSTTRWLPGGSAANTACWLAVDGIPTALVSRVGDDLAGQWSLARLREFGVRPYVGLDPTAATGTCIVLVTPDGERTMVPDSAANARLSAADVPDELIAQASWLHVSGYALFGSGQSAARHALELARAHGVPISIGAASAAPLRTLGSHAFLEAIGTGLTLIANADEAAVLTGSAPGPLIAHQLAELVGAAVLTSGAGAAYYCGPGGQAEAEADKISAVDTTGAGDAFAAGFIAALRAGQGAADALQAGHHRAAVACARIGARPAVAEPSEPT